MSSTIRSRPHAWRAGSLAHRLFDRGIASCVDLYYRFCYGRSLPFAAPLAGWVHAHERGRRGDVPLAHMDWEAQYQKGQWDMLAHRRELARYSVLAGYALFLVNEPRVLDIGCGEGLLALRLHGAYRDYLGVDISETALERARARVSDSRARFVHANAEEYTPSECYDLIVFSESLYYFADPIGTFHRYAPALDDGGAIALSMYRGSSRARAISRYLMAHEPLLDRTSVRNGSLVWECLLFGRAPTADVH